MFSKHIPNLIQGVSQQAAPERRDTQCEDQLNCLNSPVDGCAKRPPMTFAMYADGLNWEGAKIFDYYRDDNELYVMAVKDDGTIQGINLLTMEEVTVTNSAPKSYLASSNPRKYIAAAVVDDYVFLSNKDTKPEMKDDAFTTDRPHEALIHFKAGAYSTRYIVVIHCNGLFYKWVYKTPDNSVESNADYIATNQLAATFYKAMAGFDPPTGASGDADSYGSLGCAAGDTASYATMTLTDIHADFQIHINGSTLRVHNPTIDFEVSVQDGVGDTYIVACKDKVSSFEDLPNRAFDGFIIKVAGEDRSEADDFYVKYNANGNGDGVWVETVAKNIKYQPKPSTWPHALYNSASSTFDLQYGQWGNRVVGDTDSDPNPHFINNKVVDVFYDHQRLGFLTKDAVCWSKSQNPWVFFRDTVQTVLATDPVTVQIRGGRNKNAAILERIVFAEEATFVWAQRNQYRITSGSDPFKQETVEAKPSTAFEYTALVAPVPVAESLYFATDTGRFSRIRDLYIEDGKPRGSTDVTEHTPKYVPDGVVCMTASDTARTLFVTTSEGSYRYLYVYQWLFSGMDRIQSAWNRWCLPEGHEILWVVTLERSVYVIVQLPGKGVGVVMLDMTPGATDSVGATYRTHLDWMVDGDTISSSYDSVTNRTTITMPYPIVRGAEDEVAVVVSSALLSTGYKRGQQIRVVSASGTSVVVEGDITGIHWYVGYLYDSYRTESQFFLRSEAGITPADRLTITDIVVSHAETVAYEVEVTLTRVKQGSVKEHTSTFDASSVYMNDEVIVDDGHFVVHVGEESKYTTIRLRNKSPYPSKWQSLEYRYTATMRAQPQYTTPATSGGGSGNSGRRG